jgi:hypothetical protein
MRPPPLYVFFVCGFVVVLVWRCWPYLVSGLAVIGLYHLWTRYHHNP